MSDAKTYITNNASEVIEKFGGIRPMATKMGVAPTTVQGWKKRNTIPDNRIDDVVRAANENNIQLGVSAKSAPKPEAKQASVKPAQIAVVKGDDTSEIKPEPVLPKEVPVTHIPKPAPVYQEQKPAPIKKEAIQIERIMQSQVKKAAQPKIANDDQAPPKMNMGVWIMSVFMITLLMTLLFLFWPMRDKILDKGKQLAAQATSTVLVEQKGPLNVIKPDVDGVHTQAPKMVEATPAKQVTASVIEPEKNAQAPDASKDQPVSESLVSDGTAEITALLAGAPVHMIIEKFKDIKSELSRSEQMERAAGQLEGIVESLEGRLDLLDQALVIARDNSTTLGQTFADVPDENLKAAAMLLALTQLKNAIDQGGMPFEDNINLLNTMTGPATTRFNSNLMKLLPYGQTGISSRIELTNEFEKLAEDIRGLPVEGDAAEKAQASLNKVMSIKKNGEQITGTNNERALSQIQSLVIASRYKEAVHELDKLDGNAGALATSYKNKLRANIAASDLSLAISSILETAEQESKASSPTPETESHGGAGEFRELNIEP